MQYRLHESRYLKLILECIGIPYYCDRFVNVKEYDVWSCRTHKFLFYTAGDLSIWFIVGFTFDRFIAVCLPLIKTRVCTRRRAVYAALGIGVFFVGKNVHEFWTRGVMYDDLGAVVAVCGLPKEYFYFHAYVRPWIAFILITVLPFLLILGFNCMIVHCLIRANRSRLATTPTPTSGSSTQPSMTAASSGYRQTTVMCLSVSFAFLICILPSIILLIGKMRWNDAGAPLQTRLAYQRAKAVNNMMVYVNHSINFILYCLTGRKFREELKAMFACRSHRPPGKKKTPGTTNRSNSGLSSISSNLVTKSTSIE